MRIPAQTMAQYATRRFTLAGGGLLSSFNPYFLPIDDLRRQCEARGQQLLSFAQYDYLEIGDDPAVRTAASKAVLDWGVGAGASRVVGGEWSVHRELERDLAKFIGSEDALTLVSGYGTNLGLVGHILTTGDLILVDELSHNSIILGTSLSRAETRIFAHNNLDELATILEAVKGRFRRILVVVEGLYSMEGDIPNLPRLLDICEKNSAWLMIDEAHSIGVLGKTGRGICQHFDIGPARVDLIVGTLSKALSTCGGFVCAKAPVIEWLRYSLPSFVYSVGLAPHIAVAVREALAIIDAQPDRIDRLQSISAYFAQRARYEDFNIGAAIGAGVVPIIFQDTFSTLQASKALLEQGIYAPPVVQNGVPKDKPRLRFFLSSRHTRADVDRLFNALSRWRSDYLAADERQFPGIDTVADGCQLVEEATVMHSRSARQ